MNIRHRVIIVGILITMFCSVYIIRLAGLQWFTNSHMHTVQGKLTYSRNWRYVAVEQRQKSLLLHEGRATFLDDEGNLIHKQKNKKIVVLPYFKMNNETTAICTKIAELLKIDVATIMNQISDINEPFIVKDEERNPIVLNDEQAIAINKMKIFGMQVVETLDEDTRSPHIHSIGFTAQHPELIKKLYAHKVDHLNNWSYSTLLGVIGLERSLDRYLHGVEPQQIVWYEDGKGQYIDGLGVRMIGEFENYPLEVQTTLNLKLQHELEQLVEQQSASHIAVVLLDIANSDIKAIVSKPTLFPRKLDEEMMKNLAISSHRPGSIYKLITLAAAIEYGVAEENELFNCNGEYGKYGLSCWKQGGHGRQTLREAFANSCNVVFAKLSERLTAVQLEETAKMLGGIEAVGWHEHQKGDVFSLLIEEERGRTFIDSRTQDKGEIAQAVLGQRDTLLSPIQAANMLASIAREGKAYEPRIAEGIIFKQGQKFKTFDPHQLDSSRYKLKASTLSLLRRYLEEVVQFGTGSALNHISVKIAGKSGTAQLGNANSSRNNYWFVGYFPVEKPKYALAVVVLDEKRTSNPATALFGEIVEKLYE